MLQFLLATTQDTMIVSLILIVTVLLAIGISVGLKTRYNKQAEMLTKREPKNINVSLNKEYLTKKELVFLHDLYRALPEDFIAFPKVGITNLISANTDKLAKTLMATEFVDICIFTRDTLKPVLVIDLLESEASAITFKAMAPVVVKALKVVKIPVLQVNVDNALNITKLKRDIISAMPANIVAMLKEKVLKED